MAVLTLSDESAIKKKFPLDDTPVIIGRHPECEVQIDDGSVSRQHAKITYDQGQYYIQDLNSRNGTFLNDYPVHAPTKIFDQSEIKICDISLVFSLSDEPSRIRQRQTVETGSSHLTNSSVFIDDFADAQSKVMSQLDIPSHHSKTHHHASAEQKLTAITKIAHALSESVERDQVLNKILDCLFDLFIEADRGFIVLKNEDGILEPLVKTRRPSDDEQIRISRTVIDDVLTNKRPLLSSDAATDDRFDMSQSIVDFRIRSMMCAPMINSKDEAIGIIQLDTLKQSIAFTEEDLETLVTVALQASLAVQKSEMFEDAKRADGLKADLKLAHEIQQRFLPQRPPATNDYKFFSYYRPMQQVGGDYFDYVQLDEHRIGIIVADVVGHGIPAALLMAKVSAESRFALATSNTAVEAVTRMNNSLSGMNIDRFVTLVLGLLDTQKNTMTIVNAGHMPPILRSKAGEFQQLAMSEAGIPLGIMEDFEYESVELPIDPEDVIVMYTDGINEAMNAEGEQLTTKAVISEIRDSQAKSADNIGDQICKAVSRHIGNTPVIDDMCVVCIGRT
ncbi:MAG: SpoIIE family protein phosphatase [Planctomycetota bacterium]